MEQSNKQQQSIGQISKLTFQKYQIKYFKNPVILNKQYQSDIIQGVYEGGFQLWQCEIEFLKKIFELTQLRSMFEGKKVIQIGCGHGLLGLAAVLLNADNVTFQDYNQNVIKELTQPTVEMNLSNKAEQYCGMDYIWGDWRDLKNIQAYDVIIGSEVTYRQENYILIINFIKNNMKKDGVCVLANKTNYFGVGGNLPAFKEEIQKQGLTWKTISKIIPKFGGNKKQIILIQFQKTQ